MYFRVQGLGAAGKKILRDFWQDGAEGNLSAVKMLFGLVKKGRERSPTCHICKHLRLIDLVSIKLLHVYFDVTNKDCSV